MPIVESRLRLGTLTIDGSPYATQATNVTLTPSTAEEGEALEVLSGDLILPDEVTTWSLSIAAIQDFDDETGFVAFTWESAGEVVPFVWAPSGASGTSYAGNVKVRAVEVGGDVNKRLTTSADWPLVGAPTPTYA